MNHAHDLELCDWRTCVCGKSFKSSRSLHLHVTKANRAERERNQQVAGGDSE